MGQFPEDGNFGGFMSIFFFKQKATVAKPMDIDNFYWFMLANYDLGMVRKSILKGGPNRWSENTGIAKPTPQYWHTTTKVNKLAEISLI